MSSSIDSWLGISDGFSELPTSIESTRAALAWRRINGKKSVITFRTPGGVTLAAQSLRLEVNDRSSLITSEAGSAPKMSLIVFGIRNHAQLADSNIAEGYRFIYAGDEYRVEDVILTIGEVQGVSVATG